jgi:hypothetical protein
MRRLGHKLLSFKFINRGLDQLKRLLLSAHDRVNEPIGIIQLLRRCADQALRIAPTHATFMLVGWLINMSHVSYKTLTSYFVLTQGDVFQEKLILLCFLFSHLSLAKVVVVRDGNRDVRGLFKLLRGIDVLNFDLLC